MHYSYIVGFGFMLLGFYISLYKVTGGDIDENNNETISSQ